MESLEPPQPSLAAVCSKLAEPGNLISMIDRITVRKNAQMDHRATGLSLAILGAAGHFTDGLK